MRRSLLTASAALALALGACRDRGTAGHDRSPDAGLNADDIVSNDVTAIDAVTTDAANMAADVDYTDSLNALRNTPDEVAKAPGKASSAKPAPKPRPSPAAVPADRDNATTNAQ